ncbi:hypothetical protein EDD18DRAFT_1114823 [Armillaria luteobubalina]|uniref:Major facilitator superfamily (MFS) profile domain-containing protein n=1 Tax=Armillaria luteobubalina TaxID=153913 RepID=A0AA39P4J8_9AGAR|nr:hypothetical protein EDD18DRAFT_1114823 [Armillaria luteobubalina]
MVTLFLFVVFLVPVAVARNMGTVLAFQCIDGGHLPYASIRLTVLGIWALGAVAGPITGPVIGRFAAQANGWRWPQYELLWISGFALIVLLLLLPETYEPTIQEVPERR